MRRQARRVRSPCSIAKCDCIVRSALCRKSLVSLFCFHSVSMLIASMRDLLVDSEEEHSVRKRIRCSTLSTRRSSSGNWSSECWWYIRSNSWKMRWRSSCWKMSVERERERERVRLIWMKECCLRGERWESGKYQELLEGSSSFSRLLDDLFMDTDLGEEKGKGTVRTDVYLGYVKAGIPLVLSVLLLLQRFDRRNSPNTFDGWNGVERSARPSIRCLFHSHVSENHDRQFHLSEQWTNSAQEGSRIETHLTLKDFMPFRMFWRPIRCPISFFDLNPIGKIQILSHRIDSLPLVVDACDDGTPVH